MGENWLLERARAFRQRVEVASPPRDPEVDRGEIVERLRLVPDPALPVMFPCIGCGDPEAPRKHTYCPECLALIRSGVDLEAHDIPTENECRRALGWARGKRSRTNR